MATVLPALEVGTSQVARGESELKSKITGNLHPYSPSSPSSGSPHKSRKDSHGKVIPLRKTESGYSVASRKNAWKLLIDSFPTIRDIMQKQIKEDACLS